MVSAERGFDLKITWIVLYVLSQMLCWLWCFECCHVGWVSLISQQGCR